MPSRDPDGEESLAKVRVLVDDGSPGGEEIVVPAERFEMLDWAIGLLVGINMMFGGAALIAMAVHARKGLAAEPAARP